MATHLFRHIIKNSSGIITAGGIIYKLTAISSCSAGQNCNNLSTETKSTFNYGIPGVANNLLMTSISIGSGDGSLTESTAFTYNIFGDNVSVDRSLAGSADTTSYFYDAARQLTEVVEPDPDGAGILKNRALKVTYNADGALTVTERGTANADGSGFISLQQFNRVYDSIGRKTQESLTSSGNTFAATQYSYDGADRLTCSTVRMNMAALPAPGSDACQLSAAGGYGPDQITLNAYDAADQLISVTTGYLSPVSRVDRTMTYSNNGEMTTILDGENNLTTYEYDGLDRLLKTRFPSPTKGSGTSSTTDYEQLGYDANANVISRRLRDGLSIAYTYDNLNRLTHKGGGSIADRDYGYDLYGRLISATLTSSGQNVGRTFDALGRKTTEVSPQGTVSYQYDLANRRTRLTWPGGSFYVTYDYLVTGEMSAIRENGASSGIGVLATYSYDDLGRRTFITRGNGTTTGYNWDAASRLTCLTHNLVGGGTVDCTPTASGSDQAITYTSYSPADQIMGQTRANDAYAYPHTAGSAGYTANGLDQYLTAGSLNPAYTDAKGNLTNLGGQAFTYDGENRLTSVSGTTLSYDPLDRFYQISTTRLLYDGEELMGEYNTSNVATRRYVHGQGADEPVVWYEGTGTDRRWYHADERGTTIALSKNDGTALVINKIDEYGNPQAGNQGRFLFTGQAWYSSLSLYYYKARFYSPVLGRFLQTDPVGYADGMNWYNYTGSDPVNYVDPTGTTAPKENTNDNTPSPFGDILVVAPRVVGNLAAITYLPGGVGSSGSKLGQTGIAQNGGSDIQDAQPSDITVTATLDDDESMDEADLILVGSGFDSGLPRDATTLERMLQEAKKNNDKKLARRIIRQLKMLSIRNANKVRGLGKFRFFELFMITPVIDLELHQSNCARGIDDGVSCDS